MSDKIIATSITRIDISISEDKAHHLGESLNEAIKIMSHDNPHRKYLEELHQAIDELL